MTEDTYRDKLNSLQVEIEELRAKLKESQTGDTISRQAAIDAVRKCSVKEVTSAYMLIDKAEAMTELMLLPSAQPEIIQCKDCKHGTHGTGAEVYCNEHSRTMYQWDYCGRAERINNGQAD